MREKSDDLREIVDELRTTVKQGYFGRSAVMQNLLTVVADRLSHIADNGERERCAKLDRDRDGFTRRQLALMAMAKLDRRARSMAALYDEYNNLLAFYDAAIEEGLPEAMRYHEEYVAAQEVK